MRAKLGQNFLKDESVLDFEAESAGVFGKSVLEIGAGDGRLTQKLLSSGAAHITAVEIDSKLAKKLREKFSRRVKVVGEDFLKFDETQPYNVIVGNIPYYITSPILLKLARMEFDRAVICVQKEVARRILAESGSSEYGRLSVFCQLCFRCEILAVVERHAFSPVPKVDSCMVSLEKTGFLPDARIDRLLGALFSHKKKSVRNAVIDARRETFGTDDKRQAALLAQKVKYNERKVFSLSPKEALETAQSIA